MSTLVRLSAIAVSALLALPASAVQRTFVASYGLDTNPCSISSPCRGFARALTQTDANGEVVVLDSAGYGAVTISQSVSIIAPEGVYAGISVFSGTGVSVDTGVAGKVVLRGLSINGHTTSCDRPETTSRSGSTSRWGATSGCAPGVRALLLGSVRRLGETFVVELRAIDPDGDEYLFAGRDQARDKSQVLPLVDRIAARARQGLVGNAGLPASAATPVAQLVTANLEAYRHYSLGRSLEDRGLPGAKEPYRKAIELDPGFALAHYALARAASAEKAPIGELGAIATVAIRAADRAPWREARLIRAWNAVFERRLADARALYREVLERDPDDKEVLALHAAVAASAEESLAYLERALRTDPTYVPAQERIVGTLRDLGRPAELIPLAPCGWDEGCVPRPWLGSWCPRASARPPARGPCRKSQLSWTIVG